MSTLSSARYACDFCRPLKRWVRVTDQAARKAVFIRPRDGATCLPCMAWDSDHTGAVDVGAHAYLLSTSRIKQPLFSVCCTYIPECHPLPRREHLVPTTSVVSGTIYKHTPSWAPLWLETPKLKTKVFSFHDRIAALTLYFKCRCSSPVRREGFRLRSLGLRHCKQRLGRRSRSSPTRFFRGGQPEFLRRGQLFHSQTLVGKC